MKRIAVVGSGVSGMVSAWLLSQHHTVHLFEKQARIGGHTNTVTVRRDDGSTLGIDTGFITYNEPTYPNFTRLMEHLAVPTQDSDMSWSLTCRSCQVSYAGNARGAIPNRQALRPTHLKMLTEIVRFNRLAQRLLARGIDPQLTLDTFLDQQQFSRTFAEHYLLPMAAAIWSTGTGKVGAFPLDTFLTFFHNHGLLGVSTHHPWRSIVGGSNSYIAPLTRPYANNLHRDVTITAISRSHGHVTLAFDDNSTQVFDHVVLATHADEALALLADPTDTEVALLSAWQYSTNTAVLHTDTALLPQQRRTWASWNYARDTCTQPDSHAALSYHMNRLQQLNEPRDYIVTLNPVIAPDPKTVLTTLSYTHPTYTRQAVDTQPALRALNGTSNTAYAGAYLRYGFHEDGVVSAINACEAFGVSWPL